MSTYTRTYNISSNFNSLIFTKTPSFGYTYVLSLTNTNVLYPGTLQCHQTNGSSSMTRDVSFYHFLLDLYQNAGYTQNQCNVTSPGTSHNISIIINGSVVLPVTEVSINSTTSSQNLNVCFYNSQQPGITLVSQSGVNYTPSSPPIYTNTWMQPSWTDIITITVISSVPFQIFSPYTVPNNDCNGYIRFYQFPPFSSSGSTGAFAELTLEPATNMFKFWLPTIYYPNNLACIQATQTGTYTPRNVNFGDFMDDLFTAVNGNVLINIGNYTLTVTKSPSTSNTTSLGLLLYGSTNIRSPPLTSVGNNVYAITQFSIIVVNNYGFPMFGAHPISGTTGSVCPIGLTGTVTPPSATPVRPPVTQPPTTQPPVSQPPTTQPPVTQPPVTQPPVSQPPTTQPPVTQPPVTQPPVTQPPVTQPPTTQPPVTQPPVTQPPVSQPPTTQPPVTQPPVTQPPVTQPPTTQPPVTQPPVSQPPTTRPPVTQPPTTQPPTTRPPTTQPPTTQPPTTQPPTTQPPTTQPPTTQPPITRPPTSQPPSIKIDNHDISWIFWALMGGAILLILVIIIIIVIVHNNKKNKEKETKYY